MNVAVDTNVLVRAVVGDDLAQAQTAAEVLTGSASISVASACLCEFVSVLRRVYGFDTADIAAAVRALLAAPNVELNRPAAELGLAMLDAGGDFADGVIAHEGAALGGAMFMSFDEQAVSLLKVQGRAARLL